MRNSVFAFCLLLGLSFAPPVFATYNCSDPPSYHYFWGEGWYDYTINPLIDSDTTCWYKNSFVSATTLSNCSSTQAGWEFTSSTLGSLQRTVTVGANDAGSSNWRFGFELDFTDPNLSAGNYIHVFVVVTHNGVNSTVASYYRDGTAGNSNCAHPVLSFSAVNGDTIKVYMNGARLSSDAHMKVARAALERVE
jgi:hypothetical protein